MKQFRKSIVQIVVAITTFLPSISYAQAPWYEDEPEVSEVKNSSCVNETRASSTRSLVLTKDGDVVTCELHNIVVNCGVDFFDVSSEFKKGMESPDTLLLNVSPVVPESMDCTCPYNVTFTIRDVKSDSLFIYCWLYTGMVSFKESNTVAFDFSQKRITIDDLSFILYQPGHQAMLYKMTSGEGEVRMPSVISYEGQDYNVVSFYMDGISIKDMTKLQIPKSICRIGDNNEEFKNYLNGRSPLLENIEVEAGNPLLSSVDGILYSKDQKSFYCLPTGRKLTDYTVMDSVETIGMLAFSFCPDLKTIKLPESVTTIRSYAFLGCNNLEAIYIPGKLDMKLSRYAFSDMSSAPTLYAPESEIESYKAIYRGPVLPLSSFTQTLGISEIHSSSTIQTDSYDLQGRHIKGTPSHGIYVKDGKKVVR